MEALERDEEERTEKRRGPREVELRDDVLCGVRVHVEEDGERAGDVLLGLQALRDDGREEQHARGDGELLGEAGWRDEAHADDALVAGGRVDERLAEEAAAEGRGDLRGEVRVAARGGRGARGVDEHEHGDRREHNLGVGERLPRDHVQEAHEREVDRRVEARGDVDKVGPGAVEGHVGGARGLYACG